ncbi:TatD DNase family protein [Mucilaginibacter yixingensis]|uniref:TatD DNase family protein n=1 Tax=Mucilaginibacter yixingensis TaxID=1295612 RepID=A0A2T5J4T7_9SPHI|nr:TatD family hydrolase [Mucilaginibacter yixingensis]PTQ92688.1 TatD DNase family protein [Mucilaginibacter yixingensis]
MVLTDTHTHLYYETDPVKRAALMNACFENKVDRLFLPNVDVASMPMVFNLADAYPHNCFAMLGLHPCDVKDDWRQQLETIGAAIPQRKIYAIGEIGIDLHWDKTTLANQIEAFKIQIGWAKENGLPIVIHCREAFDEVFQVLEEAQDEKLRGIFHCFTGTLEQAQKVIGLNFYLGIGGVVTYKNSGLDKVVEQIDIKHIVLETDSPYLTPVPFRGKQRNQSAYITYVADKVAELHNTSIKAIAEATTANSVKIFGV